jgi:hypothetical protein
MFTRHFSRFDHRDCLGMFLTMPNARVSTKLKFAFLVSHFPGPCGAHREYVLSIFLAFATR